MVSLTKKIYFLCYHYNIIGKYSDIKTIGDGMDESNAKRLSTDYETSISTAVIADSNEKLDEITPLLHQTSISVPLSTKKIHNNNCNDSDMTKPNESVLHVRKSGSSSSSSHQRGEKMGHRKKSRSKSIRKTSTSYNLADSNLSDSDKN